MTKEQLDQAIISAEAHIGDMQKAVDFLLTLSALEECPGRVSVDRWDGFVNVHVRNMEEVHQARAYLRKICGSWKDQLNHIWYSGQAHATWRGSINETVIEIWLSCSRSEFPASLQKDGCGFREVQETRTTYVCDKESA